MTGKKIAVSGAGGFIGHALCQALKDAGYEVIPLLRGKGKAQHGIFYDYLHNFIDLEKLSSCWAVIHLAGKNIMSGLWTKKLKQEIYDSRVKSTRFLAQSVAKLPLGPKILLNASAVGIYGDQSDLKLDEDSYHGSDFLARLCIDWEKATQCAKSAGIRVVNMRFANVLDLDGGMLKPLAHIFKRGLGGPFGSGEQYFTYISRDELLREILFLLDQQEIKGPVNLAAFEPTTNLLFVKALAKMFHRKLFLPMPKFLFKLFGDQGRALIESIRAYPKILLDHNYIFDTTHDIETTLTRIFAKHYKKTNDGE